MSISNTSINNTIIDTLQISRKLYSTLPDHKLKTLKKYLGMDLKSHRALDDAKVAAEIYLRYCQSKNEDIFNEEELDYYKFVKDIIVKHNRDIKYLRYCHIGQHFNIMAPYTVLRIKLKGKKHYYISNRGIEELKLLNPKFQYETCPKSETGTTRIIILNNYKDLIDFENLIVANFDTSFKEVSSYIANVTCGQRNINDYLSSNLK